MSEELEEDKSAVTDTEQATAAPAARRLFTRRNAGWFAGILGILIVISGLFSVVLYRYGVFDNYIKSQFVAKLFDIGVQFDADEFRLSVNPLELTLKNATFNDKISGEKLLFVRDAKLGLSVSNLFAWQLSRDISIDTTEISGIEAWVKFDAEGRSNFANLNFVEEEGESAINLRYSSLKLSLRNSVIHFGDISRKIEADANNINISLEPVDATVSEEEMRYNIVLSTTDSRFVYDGSELKDISLKANGVAHRTGADIEQILLETPVGYTSLKGNITNWQDFTYAFDVDSSIDLTQTSNIFPLGATLRGVGNFNGKLSGSGEKYNIDGNIVSDTLSADDIYLRGINIQGTVAGTNTNYEANGTALAELLTFDDFRIEFARLAGNVRGTGTDFRWVGELQAAVAKAGALSLGDLFIKEAVAEYKDQQLTADAANGRVKKFSIAETEFNDMVAQNLRLAVRSGRLEISSSAVSTSSFVLDDLTLQQLTGSNINVVNANGNTRVIVKNVKAAGGNVDNTRLRNLRAAEFEVNDSANALKMTARGLNADGLNAEGVVLDGLQADLVTMNISGGTTVIYSDRNRVARAEAGGAMLGNLNIAGVRMTIRQGRVEATSNDIDAGTVTLAQSESLPEGGSFENVRVGAPVFVLEPSGRYRVTADMSLGGGVVGSVPLGAASAKVNINNDRAELTDLAAEVMDGNINGTASIAFNANVESAINAQFTSLDLSKLAALQSGNVIPLQGTTSGKIDLTMRGTNYRTAGGNVTAEIKAVAGTNEQGRIPVNGNIDINGQSGLFTIEQANIKTGQAELNASGKFDLANNDSDMRFDLNSSDAAEIERLVRILGIVPEVEQQLDAMQIEVAGKFNLNGRLTGNLTDPDILANTSLETVRMRGRELGSVSTDINISPTAIELNNGKLAPPDGGTVAFNLIVPTYGANNIRVNAELNDINAGTLLAALPLNLPAGLNDLNGKTTGKVDLSGLPNEAEGSINIVAENGTLGGQQFDQLRAEADFRGTLIDIKTAQINLSGGELRAVGTYDTASTVFDMSLNGKNVPLPLISTLLPANDSIPSIEGLADITATAVGRTDDPATFNINFEGAGRNVIINENDFGTVNFKGTTVDQILNANLGLLMDGQPQQIAATVNFGRPEMPFSVEHNMDKSPLRPFFALIPQLRGISLGGTGTGKVRFGGELSTLDAEGNRVFTTDNLTGTAEFSQLSLLVQETPLNAVEPVRIRLSTSEIVFESARFSGGGSNIAITGRKAFTDDGMNDLNVQGRLNLSLLNVFPEITASDIFLSGYSDVSVRLSGVNRTARLTGTADMQNVSLSTFIGSERLTVDRVSGRVLFSSNQAQFERATGYLGGGQFVASGGLLFSDDLQINSYRITINGNNITVPMAGLVTTGDANLDISGRNIGGSLTTLIAGNIRARRSIYTRDIDLANIVSGRREGSLSGSGGGGGGFAPRFNLTIEGRDALVIRNNIADLTASASLRITGTTAAPQIAGRITANQGTVFFRKDRYEVQRGVLEFPPDTSIEPIITLQAEAEIQGYQVFINLAGPLTDTENLSVVVRSSPALPQADVISLITTGNLSGSEAGLPGLASTGINTAAEVLTDSIINNPARKATDKLFGLNVFEIDPIISGERLNPSARLTVGRQINNDLRVTYSTNLSQDQNQVVALEYRVSNRLSVVAQYEQRSLSNVTSDRDNFSIEVRFRKRF